MGNDEDSMDVEGCELTYDGIANRLTIWGQMTLFTILSLFKFLFHDLLPKIINKSVVSEMLAMTFAIIDVGI